MGIFVSAAVFVGCQEDDPKSNELKIELSSETLEFDAPVADTKTVTLVSTRDWKVKDAEKLPEWIAINPLSGGATLNGTTVEITVTANAGTNRSESVVFTIGTLQTTLTVSQVGEGGSAEDLIVYHNDFDKELAVNSSGWPFLDSSDAWKNEKGTGISSVEYASSAVSVRTGSGFANSSNEGNTASVYAGSGKNT
ncbi:MAG: BACON domain-containing protein, partial [Bacteroidales bacterium]|nr:BACON domain-containing protein [Bacteroidales bacterium]